MKQGLTMETRVKALMMTWGSSYDDMMIHIWFQDNDRRLLKWYVFKKYVVVMVTNWKSGDKALLIIYHIWWSTYDVKVMARGHPHDMCSGNIWDKGRSQKDVVLGLRP
jgi:hypothetical protein